MQKGNISVQTENIFPIIKQFLYSDQEIFLRELVSNGVDATTKLQTLAKKGEIKGDIGNTRIEIILNKEEKTLTIKDRGIGMTKAEVEKYLNQVAFSSASEFLEKYKDEANIIGHFGLGFYSAFMVAEKVEVQTKSWQDEPATTWICDGNPSYEIGDSAKTDRGTEIKLFISQDADEYLEDDKIQQLLDKYCKFLPIEIQFGTKTEYKTVGEGEDEKEEAVEVENIINNTNPHWKKSPADLTDEDYKNLYQDLYPFSTPPLFWIHLNIDYPFNLTGILYFPKLTNQLEIQKNKIQLYSNQVFITDDVSAIVPEFLTVLHGVIDSPDIPLNVSRSYLQADKNVKKITGYITKKVSDKLAELFKNDRKDFETKWESIGTFVKYGTLTDEKFAEKSDKFSVLQNVDGEYFTIEEYVEKIKANQTDKYDKQVVIYSSDKSGQAALIAAAKKSSYDVIISDTALDNHWFQSIEQKNGKLTFVRVDSDTVDNLVQTDQKLESVLNDDEQAKVKGLFSKLIKEESTLASVLLKPLSPESPAVQITKPEFMRRMKEMQAMQGMNFGEMPDSFNIIVNSNNPLIVDKLSKDLPQNEDLSSYLLNLAMLNHGMLKGENLQKFIDKSLELVSK